MYYLLRDTWVTDRIPAAPLKYVLHFVLRSCLTLNRLIKEKINHEQIKKAQEIEANIGMADNGKIITNINRR